MPFSTKKGTEDAYIQMDASGPKDSQSALLSTFTSFNLAQTTRYSAVLLICLLFASPAVFGQSTNYLWTGQTSAQTQIDTDHTSSWYIHVLNGPVLLGGGNFTMKEGSSASATVTLTLYQGSSRAGTV